MPNFKHVYIETISISRADKARIRALSETGAFHRRSMAGTLAAIIATYNFKKHGIKDD
jgi:hypothetical protein